MTASDLVPSEEGSPEAHHRRKPVVCQCCPALAHPGHPRTATL